MVRKPVRAARADSGAGVADRDHHVVAGYDLALHVRVVFVEKDVAGLERELAAIGHGIACIDCQIENGGRELIGIGQRGPCIFRQQRRDFDVSAQRRVQQLRRLQHQRVDIDFNGLQRLLAGKGEEMLGQVGAAFGGFVDQLGDGRELGLIGDGFFQDADRTVITVRILLKSCATPP